MKTFTGVTTLTLTELTKHLTTEAYLLGLCYLIRPSLSAGKIASSGSSVSLGRVPFLLILPAFEKLK